MRSYTWEEYYDKFYDWANSTQIKYLSRLTSYGSPDEITEVAGELGDEKAASRLVNRALDAGVCFGASHVENLDSSVSRETMLRAAASIEGPITDRQLLDWASYLDDEILLILIKKSGRDNHSPDAIMEILETLEDDFIREMALHANGCFSAAQLDTLRDCFDEDTMGTLVEQALYHGMTFSPEEIVEWCHTDIGNYLIEKMAMSCTGIFDDNQAEELYYRLPEEAYRRIAKKHKLDLHRNPGYNDAAFQAPPEPKMGFFAKLFAALGAGGAAPSHGRRHNGRCNGDCANCPPHYGYRYGRWYYGHDHVYGCEFGGNRGSGSMD